MYQNTGNEIGHRGTMTPRNSKTMVLKSTVSGCFDIGNELSFTRCSAANHNGVTAPATGAAQGCAKDVAGGRRRLPRRGSRSHSQANFTANTAAMTSTPGEQSFQRPASTLMPT